MKFTYGTFSFSARYLVYISLAIIGLVLLFSRKSNRLSRFIVLLGSFFLLGGVSGLVFTILKAPLGLHPSPMCSVTKLIAFGWLMKRFPLPLLVMLGVILVLSLIGKKLFCGWICPLGALQEALFLIPGVKKIKNLPFAVTNTIRAVLFASYFVVLFAFGKILYDYLYINAFEAIHWEWSIAGAVLLSIVVLAGLFYYRPYCYLICPIGLVTWPLERISLLGIRIKRDACNDCGKFIRKSPCPSIKGLVEGKAMPADCTSCGLCISTCPTDAITFGLPIYCKTAEPEPATED